MQDISSMPKVLGALWQLHCGMQDVQHAEAVTCHRAAAHGTRLHAFSVSTVPLASAYLA
jgi:hypothetical protein